MTKIHINKFQRYLLLSLVIALLNATLLLIFFVPQLNHSDTPEYISTIRYVLGDPEGQVFLHRILNPMPVLISAALSPVFGIKNALVAQNFIFYFLSIYLIFILTYRLYQNERQAFYGTILYMGAFPLLHFGLAPLTDMPGWFFFLLSVLITLNLLKKPQLKTAFLAGLAASFGMLFKESVAVAPIFFVSFLFIAIQLPLKEKLKYILVFGAAFSFFPAINSVILYNLYSYFYLDAFRLGGIHGDVVASGFYMVSHLRIIIEIGRVLLIGWLFVLLGGLKEFALRNIERIKILIAFMPASLSFLLWCYPHNRMIFIAAPLLILLASFGILRNYKNPKINIFVELSLLSLYLFTNYTILWFLVKHGDFLQQFLIYNI